MTSRHLLTAFVCMLFVKQGAVAQDFSGFRTGNFTGVNGVFFNPANIADSRYRWDFNLASVSSSLGNNQASFNIDDITNSLSSDDIIDRFFGTNAGLTSGLLNLDIHGPSLMFNAGKKTGIALTTRVRTMANIVDVDGGLANALINDANGDITRPYTINSSSNMRVAVNGWSEFGFSFARVIKDEDSHFFKAGITAKYLGGVANGHLALDRFSGTLNEDATGDYISNANGRLAVGLGGINIDDIEIKDLTKFEGTGFGSDIGLVYEYLPDHAKYRKDDGSWKQHLNKYKFRLGVSLLDIGSINYNRDMSRSGDYTVNIGANQKFYTSEFENAAIEDIKTILDDNPQFFAPAPSSNTGSYRVSLPTTLQIDADYHLHRGFYVNLSTQLSLAKPASKMFNTQYYSAVTLTPRYEGSAFGLYVPLNYNALTQFNAGVSLRFGPLFFGTGSGLTALLGDSKQADVFFGLHLGGLQNGRKDKRKAKKMAKQ